MGALLPKALLTMGIAIAMAITGCGATDPEGASRAAERFYAAASAKDGDAACEELSETTRKELERDEQKPCREAVLMLQLSGRRAVRTSAYVTQAKVDLDGGESAFLEETPHGWRVTAAGCKPTPGPETPYDCEVES